MRSEERKQLERIEELLNQLQNQFLSTYREIHEIMDALSEESDMEEDWDAEEEDMDEELVNHMEEIFGGEEDE